MLADLSLLSASPAAAGQREVEKHTNKRQIYDQPDSCLQVRPRAGRGKKTRSEATCVPIPSVLAPSSGCLRNNSKNSQSAPFTNAINIQKHFKGDAVWKASVYFHQISAISQDNKLTCLVPPK